MADISLIENASDPPGLFPSTGKSAVCLKSYKSFKLTRTTLATLQAPDQVPTSDVSERHVNNYSGLGNLGCQSRRKCMNSLEFDYRNRAEFLNKIRHRNLQKNLCFLSISC